MLNFIGEHINTTISGNIYTLNYPCSEPFSCNNIGSLFPPGRYFIELYGGSGGYIGDFISTAQSPGTEGCPGQDSVVVYGGNTECRMINSAAGAGGYTSGYITFNRPTQVYFAIGGRGLYSSSITGNYYDDQTRSKGGYNGGGKGSSISSSGGGGSTDFRILNDDLWHRVLVAGGGGGTDNQNVAHLFRSTDDGSGGSGGGLIAQGFWVNGNYESSFVASQTTGFTFGNGEASQALGSLADNGKRTVEGNPDRAGGGGGWFGGFSSHDGNGGAGGGSSFALSKGAIVPVGEIQSCNEYYNNCTSHPYPFNDHSEYIVENPILIQGVWAGDGWARITYFQNCNCTITTYSLYSLHLFNIIIFYTL